MLPRALVAVVLATLSAGCALPSPSPPPSPVATTPPDLGPPLRFGGVALDVFTGKPIEGAQARLDLAQVRPCRVEAIVWSAWDATAGPDGRFAFDEVPRPRSGDVAFWVHVTAPGYAEGVRFVGPQEARGDLGNLTFELHPRASLAVEAPPGTILALADRAFPRLAVADAAGEATFEDAHATQSQLVAALDAPVTANVTAPGEVAFADASARGWRLEGRLVTEDGAPSAGDVAAWNGTRLVSAARAGDTGVFLLPLPPEPLGLRIEARTTPDERLGATLALDVQGPPATRQTMIMRALC